MTYTVSTGPNIWSLTPYIKKVRTLRKARKIAWRVERTYPRLLSSYTYITAKHLGRTIFFRPDGSRDTVRTSMGVRHG